MVGSSNFESKSIRPKGIPKTTTQTSPGLATTDPVFASQCTLLRRPVPFHSYLPMASPTGEPQDPMELLLCSSVGSDRRVLIPATQHAYCAFQMSTQSFLSHSGRWCLCELEALFLTVLHSVPKHVEDRKPKSPALPQPKTKHEEKEKM